MWESCKTTVSTCRWCWFCVSSAHVVPLSFPLRCFTRCDFLVFSHRSVVVSLRALELLSAQFLSFDFDVTSAARRVRRLSRDRRCENNHRHHVETWTSPTRCTSTVMLALPESRDGARHGCAQFVKVTYWLWSGGTG